MHLCPPTSQASDVAVRHRHVTFAQVDYTIGAANMELMPGVDPKVKWPIVRMFGVTENGNSVMCKVCCSPQH